MKDFFRTSFMLAQGYHKSALWGSIFRRDWRPGLTPDPLQRSWGRGGHLCILNPSRILTYSLDWKALFQRVWILLWVHKGGPPFPSEKSGDKPSFRVATLPKQPLLSIKTPEENHIYNPQLLCWPPVLLFLIYPFTVLYERSEIITS